MTMTVRNGAADELHKKLDGIYENTIIFDKAELRSAHLWLNVALATERRLAVEVEPLIKALQNLVWAWDQREGVEIAHREAR